MRKKEPLQIRNLEPWALDKLIRDLNKVDWKGMYDTFYGPEIRVGVDADGKVFVGIDAFRAEQFRRSIEDREIADRYRAIKTAG
jgi:hypothetical protein